MPDIFDLTDDFRGRSPLDAEEGASPLPIYMRAEITSKDLAKLRNELQLATGKLQAAEAENGLMRTVLAKYPNFENVYPRAWKLMVECKYFLCVAIDEPYFPATYFMLRARERELGRWSEFDQAMMDEALSEHAHLEGGENAGSE